MLNAKELIRLLANHGTWNVDSLKIRISVTDVKFAYGHTHYSIQPLEGSGTKWVREDSVMMDEV